MVNQSSSKKAVALSFHHDTPGPVYVVGTFNDWSVTRTPMKKGRNGCWETKLKLQPGEYQFRYFANGQWFTDYAADGVVPNGYGGFNSVLRVGNSSGG